MVTLVGDSPLIIDQSNSHLGCAMYQHDKIKRLSYGGCKTYSTMYDEDRGGCGLQWHDGYVVEFRRSNFSENVRD